MAVVSAKFLLRRAMACAKLARETDDDDCRERCLRLEKVYRELAQQGDSSRDSQQAGGEHRDALAS